MGLIELWNIGFFALLWNFNEWILSATLYICIGIGGLVQLLLLWKGRKKAIRWGFAALLAVLIIVCEVLYHIITGWDLLGVLFLCGGAVCMLLGAGIAALLWRLLKK